jgi:ABC-type multidrug transport system fused ATPase/permease subunit
MALLLFAFAWWAPLVLGGAWLSTNALLRRSSRWDDRFSEPVKLQQRRVRYDYELLVDAPAAKEVRIFGLADWLGERFHAGRLSLFDASWRERRFRMPTLTPSVVMVVAANGLVFAALAQALLSGTITLPWAIIFAQAALGAAQLGFEDNYFLRAAAQPMPLMLRMLGAMAQAGTLVTGGRAAVDVPRKEIRFRNVSFSYPNSEKKVIDGLNLTIPAGSSLAVVGHNGAGKTTLIKLLARLYEPTEGQVEIDGVPLSEFEVTSWRSRLAVVFQDFIQYHWTLRDNVAPGSDDDALVKAALESAGAAGLADLDTIMSPGYPGGVGVSGGQWQRVALARAFARLQQGAEVVVLDEPTANLDIRGEKEIFDRLLSAARGRTTILISHRFATVRQADRICVLENGRLAELGDHDELMARNGLYAEMFSAQAKRFTEDAAAA